MSSDYLRRRRRRSERAKDGRGLANAVPRHSRLPPVVAVLSKFRRCATSRPVSMIKRSSFLAVSAEISGNGRAPPRRPLS